MNKYLKIGGGIAVLAAAGWSGLWFLGKGEIERRVELETQQLDARGWTVSWGEQNLSGFPTGYQMSLTDVAITNRNNGVLVKLGDVIASADGSNPDRIVMALPAEIDVTIPTQAELRIMNPDLPQSVNIAIASKDLTVAAEGLDPLMRTVDVAAKGFALAVDQDDFDWKIQSAADDVTVAIKSKPEGHLLTYAAARHLATFENTVDPTSPLVKFDYAGPSITLEGKAHSLEEFLAQWNEQAADLISGTFIGTGQEIIISAIEPTVSAEAQVMTYKAGASSGLFAISEGQATYQAEDREVDLQLYIPGIVEPSLRSMRGQAEAYQRKLEVPMSAPTPKQSALTLGLIGVEPDDVFWQAIDPGKALIRDASNLIADLQGTVKYVAPVGGGLPVEVSNVTIQELELETLGATANVAGDVEILQPINLPYGELKIDMTGADALIKALSKAELINSQIRQMAEAILQVYAKKGEGDDTWSTDIVMDHEGVKINGLKMPGQ